MLDKNNSKIHFLYTCVRRFKVIAISQQWCTLAMIRFQGSLSFEVWNSMQPLVRYHNRIEPARTVWKPNLPQLMKRRCPVSILVKNVTFVTLVGWGGGCCPYVRIAKRLIVENNKPFWTPYYQSCLTPLGSLCSEFG